MRAQTLTLLSLLAACSGDKDSDPTGTGDDTDTTADSHAEDCDPIAPTQCGLPFPSTYYMTEDAASPTGWRVSLGPTTLPMNANDVQPDPWIWNERDGFSPLTPMMAHFPGLSLEGMVGHDDIGASLDAGATTVVLDAETGERVPHFAELDMSHDQDDRRALMLYPATPLAHGHRYVVGLRGLVDTAGAAIAPSAAFVALRDGGAADDIRVESRRDHYEAQVFPVLTAGGVERSELILAWDFVVGSVEGITGKMAWMQDDALTRLGKGGPRYTITEVQEDPTETVGRRIYGTMTVPLYTQEDKRGTLLTRGDDGMPYANGETEVPFIVVIPSSVLDSGQPGALLQYGHGLLGSREEITWGGHRYLPELADRYGYVLFAVDWTGMKDEDTDAIKLMLVNDIEKFAMIPERSQQGFVEQLAAMRLMLGDFAQDDAMKTVDPETGVAVSVVDPSRRYFYGNSQGSILGGSYVAMSPDIQRATMGVGGTPYALLLFRSLDFASFFQVFQTMYPDPLQVALWMGYMQTLWDSGESAGYIHQQDKDVLLQVAIGDSQVTTLGAHIHARAYGAPLIAPATREVWGLETVTPPHTGSALVEWDYGAIEPFENLPPAEETDPHEGPRRELAAQEQMAHFFATGEVIHTCEGPCSGVME